jgi:DNA-binding response OmpR family regulator
MMPKKDGFTLAKEIRMQDAPTPIIFLTAKSQTQDVIEGFSVGGNDYLKKPFSMEELIVRIENVLNKKKKVIEQAIIPIGEYQFDLKNKPYNIKKRNSKL